MSANPSLLLTVKPEPRKTKSVYLVISQVWVFVAVYSGIVRHPSRNLHNQHKPMNLTEGVVFLNFGASSDALIPLSTFEINLAYFVTQLNGFRKAKHFVDANKQAKQNTTPDTQDLDSIFAFKASPASRFTETIKHLYSICSTIDPVKFPTLKELPPSYYTPEKKIDTPDRKIAVKLIHEFKELLDSDVAA
ncbi:hypothetical protein MJO28_017206 [Puccinia striiformis f. sp. tritici]|nr:hypothetical protein MJO28_017206 [Puccinia striiformis f. sp. tritici]